MGEALRARSKCCVKDSTAMEPDDNEVGIFTVIQ